MKIAVIGTHGIGKTTLTYQIACEAKKRGKNVRVIQEVARHTPFPINADFGVDGANWIVTSQINKELDAQAANIEFLICDRSAYDPICYLKVGDHPHRSYEALEKYAWNWIKTYDKIFMVYPSGEEIINDGVRSMDKQFQDDVHDEFKNIIHFIKSDRLFKVEAKDVFSGSLEGVYTNIF